MLPSLLYEDGIRKKQRAVLNSAELTADLGLEALFAAASDGNAEIRETLGKIFFEGPITPADILYRQAILRDAVNNGDVFMKMHDGLAAGISAYESAREKSLPGFARFTPITARLKTVSELMELIFNAVYETGKYFMALEKNISSAGLKKYASLFRAFYSDSFIKEALTEGEKLAQNARGTSVTLSAGLGKGLKGTNYILNEVTQKKMRAPRGKNAILLDTVSMQLKAQELRDAALTKLLNAASAVVSQTADDLKNLRFDLSFYAGCLCLQKKLDDIGIKTCFPEPRGDALSFSGLTDVSLALRANIIPCANSADLTGAGLTVVTGANQGGKSTFLRSVGCAQLMARCGMFVAADNFIFSARPGVFTHFCKGEDASLQSGKLDEELRRLNGIINQMRSGSLLLMNESFSSTAESDGCLIADEITGALRECGVKIIFVTHLSMFARSLTPDCEKTALLTAERLPGGKRTYKIKAGLVESAGFGMDLFDSIFHRP